MPFRRKPSRESNVNLFGVPGVEPGSVSTPLPSPDALPGSSPEAFSASGFPAPALDPIPGPLANTGFASPTDVQALPAFANAPKKKAPWGMVSIVVLLAAWIGVNLYTFPYVIFVPGGAENVNEKLKIKNVKEYAAKGKIYWATVGVKKEPKGLDMIAAWIDSDADWFPREQIYGKQSTKDSDIQSKAEMEDAKLVATVVAGRRLGYKTLEGGAEVVDLSPDFPAQQAGINVGEIIEAVDGQLVCIQTDLSAVLMKAAPRGAKFQLRVRTPAVTNATKGSPKSPEKIRTVEVGTKYVAEAKRAFLGVVLSPAKDKPCHLPFEVDINSGNVGGPSAGLAMTLAILDELTPGELTGGVKVATTGTIEADGTVGNIGGVRQKTAAVRAAGAKLFIVPIDEVADATPHAGSMKVVGVRNLDDALAALRAIGGDPMPPVKQ
jgi:Lon-like protease